MLIIFLPLHLLGFIAFLGHNRRSFYNDEGWKQLVGMITASNTVFVGDLSEYTTEAQIYELFGKVGTIRKITMGLNKYTKTPCGFCFVEYYTRQDATLAIDCLNLVLLDKKRIRVDWDYGFLPERRFGRGRAGGVRFDF